MDFVFLLVFLMMPPVLGLNTFRVSTCPQNFICHNYNFDAPSNYTNNSLQSDSCGLCLPICNKSSLPKIKLDFKSIQFFDVVEEVKNNVIKLRDPKLQSLLHNQDCNTFNYNMSIPKGFSSISYTIVRNSTLLKCRKHYIPSKEMLDGFHGYDSCGDFDVYYLSLEYGGAQLGNESFIPPGCSTIQLPVRPLNEVSYDSNLFDLLTADFELEWHTRDSCTGLCNQEAINEFYCPRDEDSYRKFRTGKEDKVNNRYCDSFIGWWCCSSIWYYCCLLVYN